MAPIQTTRALGAAIRRARTEQGLSQAAVAERAGVSRQWLSELESGKYRAEIGRTLAVLAALGRAIDLVAPAPSETGVDLGALVADHVANE